MDNDEKKAEALAIEAKAAAAEGDLELMLVTLDDMAERRRKDPIAEKRYEELREACSKIILAEGPRYYIDSVGVKRYAYAVQPEPVEIDLDVLVKFYQEGRILPGDFEDLCPRKVDKEVFRRLASRGVLDKEMVAKAATVIKGTPHVRFVDPVDS